MVNISTLPLTVKIMLNYPFLLLLDNGDETEETTVCLQSNDIFRVLLTTFSVYNISSYQRVYFTTHVYIVCIFTICRSNNLCLLFYLFKHHYYISNPPVYRAPIYRVPRYNVPLCVPPISCFTIENVCPRFTVHFCFPPRSTVNRGITVH